MPPPRRISHARRLALLLLVCLGVYWLNLGARPFGSSEGHRIAPAWAMLDSGELLRTEMFGTTYVRKPPGMPWAIAASSSLLGRTEFAARAPSALCATLMAFIAYAFAARWLGQQGRWGIHAGLAQALLPLMWSPGRTAEIEMLLCFGAQLAAFAAFDLIARPRQLASPARSAFPLILLCSAGFIISILAKGPAFAPVFAGALAGGIMARSPRTEADRRSTLAAIGALSLSLLLAAAVLIPLALAIRRATADPHAVREDFGQFLWTTEALAGWLSLIPLSLAGALPISLAILFPFGKDARAEAATAAESRADPDAPRILSLSRGLAIAWFASLIALALAGVHNPRYAMPAACFLPISAAILCRGLARDLPGMMPHRRRIARWLTLGGPAIAAALLAAALITASAVSHIEWGTPRENTVKLAAARVASQLPDNATLWADGVIEARPDLFLYAQSRAREDHAKRLTVRWAKHDMLAATLPPPGTYIALRDDAKGREADNYRAALDSGALREIDRIAVDGYEFILCIRP